MALNKPQLKQDLKALLTDMASMTDQQESLEAFSAGLSDIIDAYIKSASITATPVHVAAAGMVNQGGPVTAASNLTSILS